jgi:16S rRNA (cytosine967-C5)-methyltransferase
LTHGQTYDAVLVDAPCSGLGVMRRRPDIRHRRKPEDISSLRQLQLELLTSACEATKPGGSIVYATCTLLPEENEDIVQRVAEDLKDKVVVEDISDDIPSQLRKHVKTGLTLTPDMYDTDGFYMARLRRK